MDRQEAIAEIYNKIEYLYKHCHHSDFSNIIEALEMAATSLKQFNAVQYYVIKRKKDGKVVSGTDFRYYPYHSRFANEFSPPMLFTEHNLDLEIKRRGINLKYYKVVPINIVELEETKK